MNTKLKKMTAGFVLFVIRKIVVYGISS